MISILIPIFLGVVFVMVFYYKLVFQALSDWEDISTQWIIQIQKQKLHNEVIPNKLIAEFGFQNVELSFLMIADILKKQSQKMIRINPNTNYVICSTMQDDFGLCDPNFYFLKQKNQLYVDQFFHRVNFELQSMTAYDQQLAWINFHTGFFIKSLYNTYKSSLIDLEQLYSAANSTLVYFVPAIYANLSASAYETCEGNSYSQPTDPRCRSWYISAIENQGKLIFQQPYVDILSGSVLMTCSGQIQLSDQNKIVFGMDFGFKNMIENIFSPQDTYSDGFTVLYHRYFDVKSGLLLKWEDIEFNATRGDVFTPEQKLNFTIQINKSLNFMDTGSYDIYNYVNVDQFYQMWEKGDQKYFSLIYPVTIKMRQIIQNTSNFFSIQIIMVGRVNQDYTDLIKLINLNKNPTFLIIIVAEIIFLFLTTLIFILHYGALQYYQVEIPIIILTKYMQQSFQQQEYNLQEMSKGEELKSSENKFLKKSRFYFNEESAKKTQEINNSLRTQLYDQTVMCMYSDNLLDNSKSKGNCQFKENKQKDNKNNQRLDVQEEQKLKKQQQDIKDNHVDIKQQHDDFFLQQGKGLLRQNCIKSKGFQNLGVTSKIELKEIDPMFLEMSIIIETFQKLENVIQYAINEGKKGSIINSLMYLSNAKAMFSSIQNIIGQGTCYFNIAQLHLQSERYEEAIESIFASIQYSLQEINIFSLEELTFKMQQGNLNSKVMNLRVLSKRLLGLALVLKEYYKKQIKYDYSVILSDNINILQQSTQYFNICLKITHLTYQNKSIQKYALFIELAENYLLMNNYESCLHYLSLSEVFIQNQTEISQNKISHKSVIPESPFGLKKQQSEEIYYDQILEENQFKTKFCLNVDGSYLNHTGNFLHLKEQKSIQKQKSNILPDCMSSLSILDLQSKLQFIKGVLTCKKSNIYTGSCQLLQILEGYSNLNPIIVYSSMVYIKQIFQDKNIECKDLNQELSQVKLTSIQNKLGINENSVQEEILQTENSDNQFDIVIVINNPENLKNESISAQINFIKYLNQNFISFKKDRVSIITYNSIIKIIQPLVIIQNKKYLDICINQIQNDYNQLIFQQKQGLKHFNFIHLNIDPKIVFIAVLNFFRTERAIKNLQSQLQMYREEQLNKIFTNPIFVKYLHLKVMLLISQLKQKELKKQCSINKSIQQQTQQNLLSIQTYIFQSQLNKSSNLNTSNFQLSESAQHSSLMVDKRNKNVNKLNNIQGKINISSIAQIDESKEIEQQIFTRSQAIDQSKNNQVNGLNTNISQNEQQQFVLEAQESINQLSSIFIDFIPFQKQSLLETSITSQKIKETKEQNQAIQVSYQELIKIQSNQINETYMNHFEDSLFKSIKFQNGAQLYPQINTQKPKQKPGAYEKNRKQLIVFFSFNDLKDTVKNQIFEKISFTDDVEILHCSMQSQSNPQDVENSNKLLKNDENKINQNFINQNYKIFQDLQSLINHVEKLKITKYYKYQLLSNYLSQDL
ncbi:hypothetical protein ABPG73_003955 [Tetrahymena malaccensis]